MPTYNKNTGKVEYASGDTLPTVGSAEYTNADKGILPTNGSITGQDLANPETPIKITPAPIPTGGAGLGAEITSLSQSAVDEQTAQDTETARLRTEASKVAKEQSATETSKTSILDFLTGRKGKTALTDEAYSAKNLLGTTVDTTAKALRETNAKINAIDIATNNQIQQLEKNPQGLFGGALEQERNRITRDASLRKADLYIDKLMQSADYESAKDIADRKVDLQLEEDKNKLETLQFDYEENKELFTKDEQRQFESAQADRNRKLDEQSARLKTFENTKIDLLKSANEQGAPEAIKQAIRNARTTEEALSAAGIYSGNILDRQIREAQLSKLYSDIEKNNKDNAVLSISDAQKLAVPYGTTVAEAKALGKVPGAAAEAGALKSQALTAAQELLAQAEAGNVQTGFRSAFGTVPGTTFRNTRILHNNVKSLLSLDNVKYLKGQGQVSDAERRLLEQASSRLDRSLSEAEYIKTVRELITNLSGTTGQVSNIVTAPDGTQIEIVN